MARGVLFALPVLAVTVIAFALFVVGAPRAYSGVRLFGGPTDGAAQSFRAEAVERVGEVEGPAALLELELEFTSGDGRRASVREAVDALGMCSPRVALGGGGPIRVVASAITPRGKTPLGSGRIELGVAAWQAHARRSGGWLRGASKGELVLSAAPARGVLAVPFLERLMIEVRDAAGVVAGAEITLEGEGLELEAGAPKLLLISDPRGRAETRIAPREHTVAVRLVAKSGTRRGELYALLPVVPGAFSAELSAGQLRIHAPIAKDDAFYALIDERQRLAGGRAELAPDGRGGAVALVPLPPLPEGPLWAVVSGEAELDSAGTVGWPLRPDPREPAQTLTIPDQLLLDTLPQGFARDVARRRRAQWLAGTFTVLSILLASALLASRARRAQAALEEHLARAGAGLEGVERAASRGLGLSLLIAGLCVALGFTIVALVALYRIG